MTEIFDLVQTLKRGRRVRQVLERMASSKHPLDSKTLADSLHMRTGNVIRILNRLREIGAVELATKRRRRDRSYRITEFGRKALGIAKGQASNRR